MGCEKKATPEQCAKAAEKAHKKLERLDINYRKKAAKADDRWLTISPYYKQ